MFAQADEWSFISKPHHALIITHIVAHLDYLDETIATLTNAIKQRLVPFAHKAENLCTIPVLTLT